MMTSTREKFDVAVIGAGPGGYVAAIRVAQSGKRVALIEKGYLGGTCLNVGCIPTKTLIANAQVLHTVRTAEAFGISTGTVSFDYLKMKNRKDHVVKKIRKSLEGLLLANKITIFRGAAQFLSRTELKVRGEDNLILSAEKMIIATGSQPLEMPAFPCDHQRVYNSTSILEMTELPRTLVIVGGGYIGCEFASLYAELGVKVTVIEALPSILSAQGQAIGNWLTQIFTKKGIEIRTEVLVEGIDRTDHGLHVRVQQGKPIACDKVLIAVGRKIVSEELHLVAAGVLVHPNGSIQVNEQMETNVPGIYAIGDVTGKYMLAHVATHQAVVAASNAINIPATMRYEAVPAVIFTHPEIAMVGLNLEQAKAAGYPAIAHAFPFQALGKSVASMQTEGHAQIVSDPRTGQILGAHAVGAEASVLIAEMVLAIQHEITLDALADTIHAHPTVSEAWMEAALIASGMPIHLPPQTNKVHV